MKVPEQAEAIIRAYIAGAKTGRFVWTYGDMAEAIGRPRREARLLGQALDKVREVCVARGLPDVATFVVSQESVEAGSLEPSQQALKKYAGWPGLREQQAKCLTHDWGREG